MSKRLPCPPAPGPLEDYAENLDDLFLTLAQRRGFRDYLQGLLLPKDHNKTLTALANTEPIVGAQGAPAQRLQFSSRSRVGTQKASMPAAYSCSGKFGRLGRMSMVS
jgi:hypothetical protein